MKEVIYKKYVATDGTEFNSADSCIKYENEHDINTLIQKGIVHEIRLPFCEFIAEMEEFYFVHIKSEDDWNAFITIMRNEHSENAPEFEEYKESVGSCDNIKFIMNIDQCDCAYLIKEDEARKYVQDTLNSMISAVGLINN